MSTTVTPPEELVGFPPADIGQALDIQLAGITHPFPEYHIERACSKISVFEFVLSGCGFVWLHGEKLAVAAGDAYVLTRGNDHRYMSNPSDPWEKVWLNARGALTDSLISAYHLEEGKICREAGGECRTLFMELYDVCRSGRPYGDVLAEAAIYLHRICQRFGSLVPEPPRGDAARIKSVLDASAEKKLSVAQLSAELYLSPSQIIRCFKKQYGVTPYDYLVTLRIASAKLLLENTTLSLREIALRLCFADEHYFSNVFRKRTGLPPGLWRTRPNFFS